MNFSLVVCLTVLYNKRNEYMRGPAIAYGENNDDDDDDDDNNNNNNNNNNRMCMNTCKWLYSCRY
jgi:hypothetical protein